MERKVGDDAFVAAGRHGAVRADDGADGVWNTAGNGFHRKGHTGAVILLVLRSGHIRASGSGIFSSVGVSGFSLQAKAAERTASTQIRRFIR